MKTKLFTLLLAILSLSACQKEVKMKITHFVETEQTPQWNIKINHSIFSTTGGELEKSCVTVNDEIAGLVQGLKSSFMEQSKETSALLDSMDAKQSAPYQLVISDSVFLANQNYISLLVSSYNMIGGANGITSLYGITYDTKNKKFLDKKEILDYNKAEEINTLLKTHLDDPKKCNTFEAPTVDNFTALNVGLHSISFTYKKYILGPGSCGQTTISIPRQEMKGMLLLSK